MEGLLIYPEEIFDTGDECTEEDKIYVLYNCCFGGFSISQGAMSLYNEKMKEKDPDFKEVIYDWDIDRSDPVLLDVFREMGSKRFSGRTARVGIKSFDKKYRQFITYNEYDGKENVKIDYNRYHLYCITKTLLSNKSNDEKVETIMSFLDL